MILLAVKKWIERRPWSALAALTVFVLAITAAGALVSHARMAFGIAVFTVNVASIALQFAKDPEVDRESLFMRRR